MPPQLRQLNVSYQEVEDRLLLRVSTSDDQEYRAWCTRRFTRLLLEKFEELFQQEMSEIAVAVPQEARREVAQLQHSKTVTEEAFQQPYQAEPTEYPLGEQGVLVTTLKYSKADDQTVQLNLCDKEGRGVTLNLNPHLQHQLYELFSRAAVRAQWFEAAPAAPGSSVH